MPTYDEFNELKTKCTWIWVAQRGVNGYKVTGPNGNSIFLPAAGCMGGGTLHLAGSRGFYRSSLLYIDYSYYAYLVYFISDHVDWDYRYRSDGASVRPVCK